MGRRVFVEKHEKAAPKSLRFLSILLIYRPSKGRLVSRDGVCSLPNGGLHVVGSSFCRGSILSLISEFPEGEVGIPYYGDQIRGLFSLCFTDAKKSLV